MVVSWKTQTDKMHYRGGGHSILMNNTSGQNECIRLGSFPWYLPHLQ